MSVPNYRRQIKLIFFDIDETLIVKGKDYLPASVLPAIRQLKDNGITPAIATGRTPHSFPPKIRDLIERTGIELVVAMNGQYVSYQNKVIAKYPIPTDKIRHIVNFFTRHRIDYAFVSYDGIGVSALTPMVRAAMDPLQTEYHIDKEFFIRHEVFQILPFYPAEQDGLIAHSDILDGLQAIRWHEYSVDLFEMQGSKARGIRVAIEHLGFTMENVMAFGDGLNDMEMLASVGVGVAMGNAEPQLKRLAAHITDHIEQDGVYNFLLKTGLIDN